MPIFGAGVDRIFRDPPMGGGGTVSGGGTPGRLVVWTGASTIGDSIVIDGGTFIRVMGGLEVTGTTTFNGVTYSWPAADGSSGQVLATDGSGNLYWTSSGTVGGTGTPTYVPVWTAAGTLGDSAIYDASGDIGIGTTSPGSPLHVVRTSGTGFVAQFDGNSGIRMSRDSSHSTDGVIALLPGTAGGYNEIRAGYWGATPVDLSINADGNYRQLYLTSSGRVGVGTDNPQGAFSVRNTNTTIPTAQFAGRMGVVVSRDPNLSTDGTFELRPGDASNPSRIVASYWGAGPGPDLEIMTDGNNHQLWLDTNGNVGINENNPTAQLHVSATSGVLLRLQANVGYLVMDAANGNITFTRNFFVNNVGPVSNTLTMINKSYTQTSGSVLALRPYAVFAPTSGTADFTLADYQLTVNQTGGASGNYTILKVSVTETSVGGTDNRLIDLTVGGTTVFRVNSDGTTRLLSDQIQLGTLDAFSRTQIWNYATDSVLRLGAAQADGDATNATSEGIVVYGENLAGDPMSTNDFAYARIKPYRIGLYDSNNTGYTGYLFKVDTHTNEFYLKDNSGNTTLDFDRTTGNLRIGNGVVIGDTSVVPSAPVDIRLTGNADFLVVYRAGTQEFRMRDQGGGIRLYPSATMRTYINAGSYFDIYSNPLTAVAFRVTGNSGLVRTYGSLYVGRTNTASTDNHAIRIYDNTDNYSLLSATPNSFRISHPSGSIRLLNSTAVGSNFSPTATLDVNGDLRLAGTVYIDDSFHSGNRAILQRTATDLVVDSGAGSGVIQWRIAGTDVVALSDQGGGTYAYIPDSGADVRFGVETSRPGEVWDRRMLWRHTYAGQGETADWILADIAGTGAIGNYTSGSDVYAWMHVQSGGNTNDEQLAYMYAASRGVTDQLVMDMVFSVSATANAVYEIGFSSSRTGRPTTTAASHLVVRLDPSNSNYIQVVSDSGGEQTSTHQVTVARFPNWVRITLRIHPDGSYVCHIWSTSGHQVITGSSGDVTSGNPLYPVIYLSTGENAAKSVYVDYDVGYAEPMR